MYSQPAESVFELLVISIFSFFQGHLSRRRESPSETNPRSRCPYTPSSSSTCLCESPFVSWNARTSTKQWPHLPLWQFNLDSLSGWKTWRPQLDCSPPPLLCLCPLAVSAFSSSPPVTWHLRLSLWSSVSTRWCRQGNTYRTGERPGWLIPAPSFSCVFVL